MSDIALERPDCMGCRGSV